MKVEQVVGRRMAEVRELNGITQAQLGEQLGELLRDEGRPWSRQAVSHAEQGGRSFTAVEIVGIAYVLGVPVDRLLTPPHNVDLVRMPSGRELSRRQLVAAAMPRSTAREAFDLMVGELRTLVIATNERLKARQQHDRIEQLEADAITRLFELLTMAGEAVLDEQERTQS